MHEPSLESLHFTHYPLRMSYIVASKVKEYVNGKGMMSSGDLAEHVSKVLEMWLNQGVKAAQANDRKTVRGSDILVFSPSGTAYVVASSIKQFVNGKGMMASGDLPEHASGLVQWLLDMAVSRSKANGRKTVRGEDL